MQSIVPEDLLTHYLSMAEPSRVTTVDSEILRHCAFSFPAVAYTLGRANWSCLRQLYNILARDMQVVASACLLSFTSSLQCGDGAGNTTKENLILFLLI